MKPTYKVSNRLVILAIDLVKISENDEGTTEDYSLLEEFQEWLDENQIWNDEDGTFDFGGDDESDNGEYGSTEYVFEEKDLPKIVAWLDSHGIKVR